MIVMTRHVVFVKMNLVVVKYSENLKYVNTYFTSIVLKNG
jgi:hypothetical protein